MICGTTCNDMDTFYFFDLILCHPEFFDIDVAILNAGRECIANRLGLLIHLLQHEVRISALLCCIRIPVDMLGFLLDGIPIYVIEGYTGFLKAGNLAILDIDYISGVLKDCRYITGDELLLLTETYNQRCILTNCIDTIREVLEDDAKCISTFDTVNDLGDCFKRISLVVIAEKMRHNLSICGGLEGVSLRF